MILTERFAENDQFKVQMTKIFISVSSLQLKRHYFKDHTAENRMQKFQLVPEI